MNNLNKQIENSYSTAEQISEGMEEICFVNLNHNTKKLLNYIAVKVIKITKVWLKQKNNFTMILNLQK